MANIKTSEKKSKAQSMGMHTETLTGKLNKNFLIQMRQKISFTGGHMMSILIKELS